MVPGAADITQNKYVLFATFHTSSSLQRPQARAVKTLAREPVIGR